MFKAGLLFFSLIITVSARIDPIPKITYITPNLVRDVGGKVDLSCSVEHAEDNPVFWIKYYNDSTVAPLSTNHALIIRDNRLSLKHDTDTNTFILSINDLQPSDAAVYQCQILLSVSNKVKAAVDLTVRPRTSNVKLARDSETRIDPIPKITYITPNLVRDVGGQVNLSCSVEHAEDYPVLWIKYYNDSTVLPLSINHALVIPDNRLSLKHDTDTHTFILSINDLQPSDASVYQCQIKLSVSNKVTAAVDLTVHPRTSNGKLVHDSDHM